jgi:hypothetical protein
MANINQIKLPDKDTVYTLQDSRVDTLITYTDSEGTHSDANKSARQIANEELTKRLITENADVALNTLQEIANWIQNHPDSYAAFVSQYNGHKHTVTHTPTGTISQPTFTGTADSTAATADSYKISVSKSDHTHSGSFTPAGGVSQPTFTGTAGSTTATEDVVSVTKDSHTHSGSFTPAGGVSQPTFTGTAGSTTSITGTDSTSILTSVKSEGTKPSITSWGGLTGSVANKCLTISYTNGTFNAGSMPTFNSATKTFASATHTHEYTPSGTVSKPTFTGTAGTVSVNATSSNIAVATDAHTHGYTPKGTVSKPTFTGTASSITVSVPDKQATGESLEDTHESGNTTDN